MGSWNGLDWDKVGHVFNKAGYVCKKVFDERITVHITLHSPLARLSQLGDLMAIAGVS